MSEYQYYEFVAVDRPLSAEARERLQGFSSRATVTETRAVYTYNYGDFGPSATEVLARYFDFMFYIANWGTRWLLMRFSAGLLDLETASSYLVERAVTIEQVGDWQVLDISTLDEDRFDDWAEGEGWATQLLPLREELIRGDFRALYLAWLYTVEHHFGGNLGAQSEEDYEDEEYDDEYDDDEDTDWLEGELARLEPPVPSGLKDLTAPQRAVVRLLGISDFLLAAAAESSSDMAAPPESELLSRIPQLPEGERNRFLEEVGKGDRSVGVRLLRRLEKLQRGAEGSPPQPAPTRRTVGELLKRSREFEMAEEERKRQEAERRKQEETARRKKHIIALAPDEPRLWERVERHIEEKLPKAYHEAVKILVDLRDIARYRRSETQFEQRIAQLTEQYRRRPALLSSMRGAGLTE